MSKRAEGVDGVFGSGLEEWEEIERKGGTSGRDEGRKGEGRKGGGERREERQRRERGREKGGKVEKRRTEADRSGKQSKEGTKGRGKRVQEKDFEGDERGETELKENATQRANRFPPKQEQGTNEANTTDVIQQELPVRLGTVPSYPAGTRWHSRDEIKSPFSHTHPNAIASGLGCLHEQGRKVVNLTFISRGR